MDTTKQGDSCTIVYLGPLGAGFGFQLAGMTTIACSTGDEMLTQIKKLKERADVGIIFADEVLAEEVLDEIENATQETLPAIVLLTNPVQPLRLAAQKMNRLMVQAVGSNILGK